MNDGRHYLSRVNPSFARRIENQLKTVREVASLDVDFIIEQWEFDLYVLVFCHALGKRF